jgi:hypothetical protein
MGWWRDGRNRVMSSSWVKFLFGGIQRLHIDTILAIPSFRPPRSSTPIILPVNSSYNPNASLIPSVKFAKIFDPPTVATNTSLYESLHQTVSSHT